MEPAHKRNQQDPLYSALLRLLLRARFDQESATWMKRNPPNRSNGRAALRWIFDHREMANRVLEDSEREARAIADWAHRQGIESGQNALASVIRALAGRARITGHQRRRRGRPAEKWDRPKRIALLMAFEYARKRGPHLSKARIAARLAEAKPGVTANAIRAQITIGYKELAESGHIPSFDFAEAVAVIRQITEDRDLPINLLEMDRRVEKLRRQLSKRR